MFSPINTATSGHKAPPARTSNSASALVLVVEDHQDTRQLYRLVLEGIGARVIEAADGAEAIDLAQSSCPDLILMDTNLPGVDGLMATRFIRKLEPLRNTPIIFVAGHAQPQRRVEALKIGANEYLVKPVALTDLESAVQKQLAFKRTQTPAVMPGKLIEREKPSA